MYKHGLARFGVKPQDVVSLYTVDHLTMQEIADRFNVTRAAISKRIRKAGITTHAGTWVKAECSFCGSMFEKRRKTWRIRKHHFCRPACYFAYRENPGYKPWRQGQRLARALVSQYFAIPEGAIVHHKDTNQRNNNLDNLAVYLSQSDHLKHHHGNSAHAPIWDGSRP